jgi:hypothetical protein
MNRRQFLVGWCIVALPAMLGTTIEYQLSNIRRT